jgi:peptide/nickel transport system permease protein
MPPEFPRPLKADESILCRPRIVCQRKQPVIITTSRFASAAQVSWSAEVFRLFAMVLKRCLGSLPLLFLLSLVSFCIIKVLPGDPVEIMLGTAEKDVPPEQVAIMRKELGLDQPPVKQYAAWATGVVTKAQFGRSYRDGRPAITVIKERLPATLVLVGTALTISFTIGIVWGLFMAWLRLTRAARLDSFLIGLALLFYSAPSFWVGFLAIAVVANCSSLSGIPVLGLHNPGETGTLLALFEHALLPALVLASRRTAKVALFVRASTIEEMGKGYVITARGKGLSNAAVIIKHVMKNSFLPVASLIGLSLPALLGGSVLVESVFAWPGMGRLAVDATFGRNYPVLLALIMIYGTLVIASNLIADIFQLYLDPRARDLELDSQSRLSRGHA